MYRAREGGGAKEDAGSEYEDTIVRAAVVEDRGDRADGDDPCPGGYGV